MNNPQSAILNGLDSRNFYFLEYQLLTHNPNDAEHQSPDYQGDVDRIIKTLKSIGSPANCHQLIAFGPDLAKALLPECQSLDLQPMNELKSSQFNMPSTQGDLLFWLHGTSVSDIYDQVMKIQSYMSGLAHLTIDQAAFTYHESKDLFGFEDGTANPKEDARLEVALVKDTSTDNNASNQNGSIVFTQKWQHQLEKFLALPIKQQEQVIGRTKVENIELTGDDMPEDSHVSRTDVKVAGEAMKIYRRSAPYGNATEKGLMFLCFACHQSRIQIQLERMTGCTEDQLSDQIMNYSIPVSGSYWYAPSEQQLSGLTS